MEDRDTDGGLRSSWENVHKMPDQADAAQEDCERKQEGPEADTPVKDQAGAQGAERHSKGSPAPGDDTEWILEDPAISEQACFEGEAEVIQASQKDSGLHFEEEGTCVHPSKPDFDAEAALGFDSASEGDPEASSLAGSDCEYTFVLDRHNLKLSESNKEAPAIPDKGRTMPQAPSSPLPSPPQTHPSPSSQLMATPSLQAARSGSQSPAQSPQVHSPAPLCTEGGELGAGIIEAEQKDCTADLPSHSAACKGADQESAAGMVTKDTELLSLSGTADDETDISNTQTALAQDDHEASGSTASGADEGRHEISCPQSPLGSPMVAPAEMRCSSDLPPSIQSAAAEVAAQRRRQLDAVGVIPGGRAAFGAKLPSHEVSQASSGSATTGSQQQAVRSTRAVLPELARPASPDWARPRGRSSSSFGGASSGPSAAAAMLLRRLQARPGPAALDGRRVPVAARRMEVRALPGAMLECYDSLWHGSSGILASQS